MNEVSNLSNEIAEQEKAEFRNNVVDFEANLRQTEGSFIGDNAVCPLKHTFADGIYVREIFIPAGAVLVGKIHKHGHPNFLMSGEVEVVTEGGGAERLVAPLSMISSAGTKRVVYTITDTVWVTIHHNPTNTEDLAKLEKIVIADSYEDYEKFKKIENNKFVSLYKKIIKKLIS